MMTPVPRARLVLPALLVLVVAGCGDDGGDDEPPAALTATSLDQTETGVPVLEVEVLTTVPHDTASYTQGLVWDEGVLYEGTGIVGQSEIAELDPATGETVRSTPSDPAHFGEGLALVDDELVQITWQDGVATRYDVATFEPVGEHRYEGEGWGLCFDGERLVMSDGSPTLTFRDPVTFEETGTVEVTLDGEPVEELNELECVTETANGAPRVYANVWHTDTIVAIDPASGEVTTVIDAAPLRDLLEPAITYEEAVLNGIAHDPDADTFWLTGKLWPQLFEVRLIHTEAS
jgi:glutamine cyclotransferase